VDYTSAEIKRIKRLTTDIPRRNSVYLFIRGETLYLAEWARRCGITSDCLRMIKMRYGTQVMVRTIKAGLDGKYDAKLNKLNRRMMHLDSRI
jgi:hypothetical protein